MSHHFEGEGCRINYNSDLSGLIDITAINGESIQVPGRDILDFVASFLTMRRISALEQMETHEVFGVPATDIPKQPC